jgi:hypothetical protein
MSNEEVFIMMMHGVLDNNSDPQKEEIVYHFDIYGEDKKVWHMVEFEVYLYIR